MTFYVCLGFTIFMEIIIIAIIDSTDFSHCPTVNSNYPTFTEPVDSDVEMVEGKSEALKCCIFGVSKILWYFSSYYNKSWELKSQNNRFYMLFDSNRTLLFLQPKMWKDSGIYKCLGLDHLNNSISAEIVLYVGNDQKEFKIIGHSNLVTMYYNVNSEQTIYCLVKAHKKSFCIFSWNRKIQNQNPSIIASSNLTTDRINDTLVNGYTGFTSLSWILSEKNHRIYNFSLNLKNINESHEGYYSCRITHSSNKLTIEYSYHFQLNRMNLVLLVIEILVSLVVIMTIVFVFQYDIKIISFQIIRKLIKQKSTSHKYNFFILYNFECENEFKVIYQVVQKLEARGFSTYFYHRDKTYGRDSIEDLTQELKRTDLIVIWASENMWKNSTCNFCIQILLNRFYNIKRIYIMTSKKEIVLKTCDNKQVLIDTRSCLSSKLFKCDLDILSKCKDKTNYPALWYWHHFLSWLISSLPLGFV